MRRYFKTYKDYILLSLIVLFSTLNFETVNGQEIVVSKNGHFFVQNNNAPFFWLGDTAWELFYKLNKEETITYLKNRADKGFNVIQCVVTGTGISGGLDYPNREGETVFNQQNPLDPNKRFFRHIDWVIDKAKNNNLVLALLPVWGSLVVKEDPVFNKEKAYHYGLFLGNRYKNKTNLIWVLGGDKVPAGYETIWENMAKGIKESGDQHLITYHISGEHSSSEYFQNSKWLDFNMIQSGHMSAYSDSYKMIANDVKKVPAKPVVDAEMIYEGMPIGFCPTNGRASDHNVRVVAYWDIFAGAAGVTYGSNGVFQFYNNEKKFMWWAEHPWNKMLNVPGSLQMQYLKNLMLSRPFVTRIPDQSLITPARSHGLDHLLATRDGTPGKKDATYIMVYFPYLTHSFKIRTDVITGSEIILWWYNPRTGEAFKYKEITNTGAIELPWGSDINTDHSGPDWVLVIDDKSKNYPAPGTVPEKKD